MLVKELMCHMDEEEFYVISNAGEPFLITSNSRKDFTHFYGDDKIISISVFDGKILVEVE